MDRIKGWIDKEVESVYAIDKDRNGRISKSELQQVLGNVTDDSIRNVIGDVDADGNGEIDINEFVQAIMKITKKN